MNDKIKKVAWGITGMTPYNQDVHEGLGMPAYVRIENYQFIQKKAENLEAENARLKAENERLRESASSIISILCQHVPDSNLRNLALREWNDAKEGKPSV